MIKALGESLNSHQKGKLLKILYFLIQNFKGSSRLDYEIVKSISQEAKRFLNSNKLHLTQTTNTNNNNNENNTDLNTLNNASDHLSNQIIEICNCNNTVQRIEKIKLIIDDLFDINNNNSNRLIIYDKETELLLKDIRDEFYKACLYEACVQASLLKPILLTKFSDLIVCARNILDSCSIYNTISSSSPSVSTPINESGVSNTKGAKRIKLEKHYVVEQQQQHQPIMMQQQQQIQSHFKQQEMNNNGQQSNPNLLNFYAVLAQHFQNSLYNPATNGLMNNNNNNNNNNSLSLELQLKQNLKYQEDLRFKLASLSTALLQNNNQQDQNNQTSTAATTQATKQLIEQLHFQLNEATKKYNELVLLNAFNLNQNNNQNTTTIINSATAITNDYFSKN